MSLIVYKTGIDKCFSFHNVQFLSFFFSVVFNNRPLEMTTDPLKSSRYKDPNIQLFLLLNILTGISLILESCLILFNPLPIII